MGPHLFSCHYHELLSPILLDYTHHTMSDTSIHTLEQAKAELTKAAYGADKVKGINDVRQQLAKSVFEARKAQIQAQLPVFEKRKELVKDVSDFWFNSLQKSAIGENFVEESDLDVLKHPTDISVKYSESDPREFDVTLSFSENPYFSNATLTKSFTVPAEIKKEPPFAMEVPTESPAVSISWKSDKQNLVKNSPRPDMSKLEEFDEFEGSGSFFNFFTAKDDEVSVADLLLQVYEGAHDIYADDDSDLDDEEDEEDDDEEVDLGDSETDMPKKK